MANKSIEANIKCPFYIYESRTFLSCEGLISGTVINNRFESAKIKKSFIKRYCYHEDGGKCPIAKALYKKYDDFDKTFH